MIFDARTAIRAALAFLVLCAPFLLVVAALARDPQGVYAGSKDEAWFKGQHNANGEWCCDHSDGHRYYGSYSVNADGSVTVEGETIPKEKVLTGPNPTGTAVWWWLTGMDGSRRTYCFALGGGV